MIESLLLGTPLGLAAGLSPGPLMALATTTTLQRGIPAGVIIAASPLLSDGPLIAIVLLAVRTLSHTAIVVLYLLGGAYVIYLGVNSPAPLTSTPQHQTELSQAGTEGNTPPPHGSAWSAAPW